MRIYIIGSGESLRISCIGAWVRANASIRYPSPGFFCIAAAQSRKLSF